MRIDCLKYICLDLNVIPFLKVQYAHQLLPVDWQAFMELQILNGVNLFTSDFERVVHQ